MKRKLLFIALLSMCSCASIKNMPRNEKNAYKMSFVIGFGLESQYHIIKH